MAPVSGRRAVLFVRNPFTHDARVLRAAHALRARGYDPLVVAVTSTTVTTRREVKQGIPVLRLNPTSPLTPVRARLRGAGRAGGGSGGATAGTTPPPVPGRPNAVVRANRWLRTLDFYRRGIGVLRRERPALVHCNDYNTMWIGVAARLLGGTAVVYDSHELWADRNGRPEPRWWLMLCEALFVRVAHVVIAASPGYADAMARRYRVEPPAVVLNVPDAPPPPAPEPATEPDVAVYVGGLQPHRGIEQAIDALPHAAGLRLRLLGAGRPEYVESLRDRARERGVDDRLELPGAVPPDAVVDAIRGLAFGVAIIQPMCLSYRLTAPNKVFEYFAAGLPSLITRLPVMARIVEETGAGLAVPADDAPAIGAAALQLAEPAENLRMREAAVAAGRRYRWEREQRILDDAYARAEEAAQ